MEVKVLASWLLIAGYAAAIIALVVRGARRNKSVEDYAVGNIAFSPVAVGLALAASTPAWWPTSGWRRSSGCAWCCRSRCRRRWW
jgi:Na+/proline symporter